MNKTPLGAKRCDCGANIAVSMKACSACTINQLREELTESEGAVADLMEQDDKLRAEVERLKARDEAQIERERKDKLYMAELRAERDEAVRQWHVWMNDERARCKDIAVLQAELTESEGAVADLMEQDDKLRAEVERLSKRDCNATVELCYATAEQPFEREQLQIVDVGVSGNIYVVESDVLTRLQSEKKVLRESLGHLIIVFNGGMAQDHPRTLINARKALKETAMNKPIEQTNDHNTDLLEYLESTGTPGELAEAFEQAEEDTES